MTARILTAEKVAEYAETALHAPPKQAVQFCRQRVPELTGSHEALRVERDVLSTYAEGRDFADGALRARIERLETVLRRVRPHVPNNGVFREHIDAVLTDGEVQP